MSWDFTLRKKVKEFIQVFIKARVSEIKKNYVKFYGMLRVRAYIVESVLGIEK